MFRGVLFALAASLSACGTPPTLTLSLVDSDADAAFAHVNSVTLFGCDGSSTDHIDINQVVNLVDGHTVSAAAGSWCEADVHFAGDLVLLDNGETTHIAVDTVTLDDELLEGLRLKAIVINNPPLQGPVD